MKKSMTHHFSAIPRVVSIATAVIIVLLFAAVIMTPERICISGLNTLEEASAYAHAMPELPPTDNTNLVRPDYSTFYRATAAGYWLRKLRAIACCLGIRTQFTWSPLYFRSLLEISLTRLKNTKVEKNIVYKMAPSGRSRYIIIGDLYGAYHSVVRNLLKLQELKILDNSLKIVAPDTYIVFMGSAISRSPYGMETLGLILRLMEMNLDTVIYLRGNHEDNKYWEAFGLKEQLELKYGAESEAVVATINAIFMHLPLGLYLAVPEVPEHFVKLSYLGSDESTKLKEDNYAHFLEAPQVGILDKHEIKQSTTHNNKIVIDGGFHSEKKRQTFQENRGLRRLPDDAGSITWTVMSAPTLVMQKGFKFISDAFAIVQVAPRKEDWMVTEYSQDSLKKDGYKTTEFQFFTGATAADKRAIGQLDSSIEKKTDEKKADPVIEKTPIAVAPMPAKVDILGTSELQTAIHSNFIQTLIGGRKKKKPMPAVAAPTPAIPAAHLVAPIAAPVVAAPALPQRSVAPTGAPSVAASVAASSSPLISPFSVPLPSANPAPTSAVAAPTTSTVTTKAGEMSITIGTPTKDAVSHTMVLPLTLTIKD
ncbi:MAG: hypothetical protein QG604_69 [Candidatus Dependentiae bacterium]|nr:hypothetical protein [Candidatus Dependentiae bacterium]